MDQVPVLVNCPRCSCSAQKVLLMRKLSIAATNREEDHVVQSVAPDLGVSSCVPSSIVVCSPDVNIDGWFIFPSADIFIQSNQHTDRTIALSAAEGKAHYETNTNPPTCIHLFFTTSINLPGPVDVAGSCRQLALHSFDLGR